MTYQYSSIKLRPSLDGYMVNGNKGKITGLSSINIFVGENNAGKSRFMRELSKTDQSEFEIKGLNFSDLEDAYQEFQNNFAAVWRSFTHAVATGNIPGYGYHEPEKIDFSSYIPSEITKDFFDETKSNPTSLLKLLTSLRDEEITVQSFRDNPGFAIKNLKEALKQDYANSFMATLENFIISKIDFDKCYIPTIRSLNDFDDYQVDKNADIFENRIRKIYDFDEESNIDIFTGQKIYDRIKAMLLGDIELRQRIAEYEKFLSQKLFDGQDVVIIPKVEQDVIHVKIGKDERPIYELGDGIQSLIILTFPLFESRHGLFFIEEPETTMHPGMQRKFLEAVQANPQHQYYFTTHSNHLLDLTIDYSNISIYTFTKKNDQHHVELVTHGDKKILDLIGARSTSVFLANKSIWVEGITDRLYLRKYLELFGRQNPTLSMPREDIDYVFVEYGGNNITHWSFLDSTDPTINTDRITSNLMLVTDRDGENKQERKSALKTKLGKRYLLLDEREIENTLSIRTISNVVGSYEKEEINMLGADTSKLADTPIGEFIEHEFFIKHSLSFKRKGGYKDDSGTIKSKLSFCQRAIEDISVEDMSESANKIAKKIYEFIVTDI